MLFYNREKEIKEMKVVLSGEPNLVYFVYGPINSGKTVLLMKVFEDLSKEYCVFYINFRWRDVQTIQDLIQVLFDVKYGEGKKTIKEVTKEIFIGGAKAIGKIKGIPVPEKIFEYLFGSAKKVEDVFRYLERVFEEIKGEGYQPVFVLDEMQTIKEVVNATGRPVVAGLFNFFVGVNVK